MVFCVPIYGMRRRVWVHGDSDPGSSPCKGDVITELDYEPGGAYRRGSFKHTELPMYAVVTIYVDGAGGISSGYGYYVRETGESEYVDKPDLTNNQAEYSAVLAALERFAGSAGPVDILSDSQVVVRQINHEYAINDPTLRDMAREVWRLLPSHGNVRVQWIPRRENLAGRMLGS